MRPTRRFWGTITLGGFLSILGAILDQPVLLVGAAGLGIWLLINAIQFTRQLSGLLDTITVSQSSIQRRVSVGDPMSLTLHVDRGSSPETAPALPLRIELTPPLTASGLTEGNKTVDLPSTETTADRTIAVTPKVAGTLEFSAPTLTTIDANGLFTESITVGDAVTVIADPRSPRNLHIGASGTQMAAAYGNHSIEQPGPGLEPIELRKYVHGDDISRIDWKATARLNEPHIRKYEAERSHETLLFFDQRSSLGDGNPGERKLDYLREVALAFVQSAASMSDPIGFWGVGDGGITEQRPAASTPAQYDDLQELLVSLDTVTETATSEDDPNRDSGVTATDRAFAPSRTPAEARLFAARLDNDRSPFAATLQPYVAASRPYVERVENRPLFAALRSLTRELSEGTRTVFFTDDTNKAETYEVVQLAAQNSASVTVFLAPTVLFESGGLTDIEAAHRDYQEFDSYRRKLTNITGVSAYEVGPGHRLNAILAKQANRRNTRQTTPETQ